MTYHPKSDFIAVMMERGFLADCTDLQALDEKLSKGVVTAYIGYDATAQSLHVGHLLNIMESPHLSEYDAPRSSEELKALKKRARQKSVEDLERVFVLEALNRNDWNVTQAAAETGMQRTNFQALMTKYDIHVRKPPNGPG